jgi:hypothetical protein
MIIDPDAIRMNSNICPSDFLATSSPGVHIKIDFPIFIILPILRGGHNAHIHILVSG